MCPINIQSEFYQCKFSSSLAVFNLGRAGEAESIFMHHFTQTVLLTSFTKDDKEGIVIKRKKNSGIVDTVLAFYLQVHLMLSTIAERAEVSKQTKSTPPYLVPHSKKLDTFLYLVLCELQRKKAIIHFERVKYPCETSPCEKF